MIEQIQSVEKLFLEQLSKARNKDNLEEIRIDFLSKKGKLPDLMKGLKNLSNEEKGKVGQEMNRVKQKLQKDLEEKRIEFKKQETAAQLEKEWIDITLDQDQNTAFGSLNPISIVQYELEDLFEEMGFQVLDGPHIETEYYNFEALNIPAHHPARDMQDTFYLKGGKLLRSQTSTIQIRGMENLKPPFRIIGPGKVFRSEKTDACHETCFHQLEGMLVDENISVANLIYFMKTMLSSLFKKDVQVRLRPGYFPFVEPGFELEMTCTICNGTGCSMCKQIGWIELLGCGMIHPNVLRHGGIDPEKYSGFAFGMGIDRLAIMKYGIKDIRLINSGKLDFLTQFSGK